MAKHRKRGISPCLRGWLTVSALVLLSVAIWVATCTGCTLHVHWHAAPATTIMEMNDEVVERQEGVPGVDRGRTGWDFMDSGLDK
jgi:hypothetical protein